MELIEKANIIHYHRHRIKEFSGTVKSLGWKGEEGQLKRFEVLVQVADLNDCSIMDLGCGRGDLKGFLDERVSEFTYIGIDQMPEFIVEAKQCYGHLPNTEFYQTDFSAAELPEFDYVIASGALGYRSIHSAYYKEVIARMYASANYALAFNMLDRDTFPEHPLLVGHDVQEVEAFCKSLSPRVKLIQGYLVDDFTIFMYRVPDNSSLV